MSGDLANLLAKELAAYSKEIEEEVDEIAEDVAEETVQELKDNSPKRYGKYRRSWRKKKLSTGSYVVYNAVASLTHLLEKGHLLRNGGRVAGIVHIKPAEENAIEAFQQRIKELGR
ncbi:HK97 gp10 family phage protein [Streptococcus suis]